MKTLIKIDRKTVRKNPDYEPGDFTRTIPGAMTIYLNIIGDVPDYLEFISAQISVESNQCYPMLQKRILTDHPNEELLKRISKDPKILNIEMDRDMIDVTTIGEPKYLYSYVPTEIECLYCNKKFLHTELVADSSSESDYYSDEICPHCGDWDCCDIKYEELTDDEINQIIES